MRTFLLLVLVLGSLTQSACHHAAEVGGQAQPGAPQSDAARATLPSSPNAPEGGPSLAHAERLLAAGKLEEAVPILQHAVTRAPDQVQPQLWLGGAFLGLGKAPQAAQTLTATVEHWPTNAAARLLLGYALLEQGQSQGAVTQFEHVLQLPAALEQQVSAHLGLAAVYEGQKDQPRADRHYASALAIAPELQTVLTNIQKELLWRPPTVTTGTDIGHAVPDQARRARIEAELEKLRAEKDKK